MTLLSSSDGDLLPRWLVRLLLAAMLLFGSEVLAWLHPQMRLPGEWLLRAVGKLVLAAVLHDFVARYRVFDLFGVLTLAGSYGLLSARVLNPAYAYAELPRTLFTRVMGTHALLAAEMIGLFLIVTNGRSRAGRGLLVGCIIVGLAWGLWVRWWPQDEGYEAVSLMMMLAWGAGGLALILALLRAAGGYSLDLMPDDMRLSRVAWGVIALVLLALLVLRFLQNALDPSGVFLVTLLLVLCWAMLWFRGRVRGANLLDGRLPMNILPLQNYMVSVLVFAIAAVIAFNLPQIRVGEVDQLTLIGLAFTAYGLAWLPTVSLVLGVRGYLRQVSQRQL